MFRSILYIVLITFALCIDAFQAFLAWGFMALGSALSSLTPVGGGIAGAAAGGYICASNANGFISSLIGGAACAIKGAVAGAAVSSFGIPLGFGLSVLSDFCISATFGVVLIMILYFCGMFYPKAVLFGGFLEIVPGLDMIPGWTAMTVKCILNKTAEGKGSIGVAASLLSSGSSPTSLAKTVVGGVSALNQKRQEATQRATNDNTQQIKGEKVRPQMRDISPRVANDNNLQTKYAA